MRYTPHRYDLRGNTFGRCCAMIIGASAFALLIGGCGSTGAPTVPRPTLVTTSVPPLGKAQLDAMVATMDTSTLAAQGAGIAAYAQYYGIHTIFLDLAHIDAHTKLPKRDPATVAALNGLFAVADVYLITGNDDWQLQPNTVPAELADVITVARMYPAFKGITYDLEPQALPGWKTNRQATITQYVTFLKFLLVSPGGYTFKTTLVAAAPYYAINPNSSGTFVPSLLQEVEGLSPTSGIYLMDYRDSPAAQMDSVARTALTQLKKPYWLGSTTNPPPAPGISYHGTPAQTFEADMAQLRVLAAAQNGNLSGLFDNAWNSEATSLQTVLPPP
ncbi:MAG: hypothetical protein JO193_00405 [Candidatus Eremiobacteraeota bacterium]|nr:hypothetical protein [Candidatus Eremiobacteraeota bacterium]